MAPNLVSLYVWPAKTSSLVLFNLFCFVICDNLVVKKPWSREEKEAVLRHFRQFILDSHLPGKRAIELCKQQQQHVLAARSWRNIKDFCRNEILACSKKQA